MFWVIVLALSLPGPTGKPVSAPVLLTPATAYVAPQQCLEAIKTIRTALGGKGESLKCAEVTVISGKAAESF